MYIADCHTHTDLSPDANTSMTGMAAAAAAAGLDELCFTDHVEPLVWNGTELRGPYDWDAWRTAFAAAQAAWGDRISLRLGLELGDPLWAPDRCAALLADAPELDFIISSVHRFSRDFGGQNLFYYTPADEDEALAGIADYLAEVQKLAAWGGFDVLGHVTLPLRYLNENQGFRLSFDRFEPEMERIFRTLVENGCGIELNTNRGNTPLPDEKWLRLYRELGGEIITLGTDAHDPASIGCAVAACQGLLRRCGFTKFCTFTKREPVWHQL